MSLSGFLRGAWEIIPVVILLLIGGAIALRSGVPERASSRTLRQLVGNLYQMLLRIMGYVAVLFALQYWIGLRPTLGW
jgi:hypothetical protein